MEKVPVTEICTEGSGESREAPESGRQEEVSRKGKRGRHSRLKE